MLVTMSLKIQKDIKNKLQMLGVSQQRSASYVLREILEDYFKRKVANGSGQRKIK